MPFDIRIRNMQHNSNVWFRFKYDVLFCHSRSWRSISPQCTPTRLALAACSAWRWWAVSKGHYVSILSPSITAQPRACSVPTAATWLTARESWRLTSTKESLFNIVHFSKRDKSRSGQHTHTQITSYFGKYLSQEKNGNIHEKRYLIGLKKYCFGGQNCK